MFAPRMISNTLKFAQRRAFSAAPKDGYKQKTVFEAWTSDAGAYPVMGVIIFAICFSSTTALYFMSRDPDARISKASRKSIFRGDVQDN